MKLKTLILMILRFIAIGLFATIIGVGVSLWVAYYFPKPILFLIAGVVGFIIVYVAGVRIHLNSKKVSMHKVHKVIAYSIGLFIMISFNVSFIIPLPYSPSKQVTVKGQKFWNLPSGLKIAYVCLKGKLKVSLPPVIFIHGGPGTPDMSGDISFFGELAHDGYDVYTYDQVGSGDSSRLKDPREYTIQRDVEDLEFVRKKIGEEKIILIGHSYGGEIVANYMATYGEHVEKVVFSSPGAINPEDTSGGNLTSRLTSGEKWTLYKLLIYPRVLMTYGLLQINPIAAIKFAGDAEMDARFDNVYQHTQVALNSRKLPERPKLTGLGFYANQTPQSHTAKDKIDIRESLNKTYIPALIIKNSDDYLSWSSGLDYKKALKNSSLVYFSSAGHNGYQDKPEIFMKVISAFLNDKDLPVNIYNQLKPPVDYEGLH